MPDYRLPPAGLLSFAASFILGSRRSFARDGATLMRANPYPLRVSGLEHIPVSTPFILVMNHYNRKGLRPQLCALIVSGLIKRERPQLPEIAWVYAEELEEFIYAPIPVPGWLMRILFRRLGKVYGIIPMPRAWRRTQERAAAIRHIQQTLSARPVGLTPEGGGPGVLREPPPGTGLLLMRLAAYEAPILPVAVCEEGETLIIAFGPPCALPAVLEGTRHQRDETAAALVMLALARLLPPEFQGAYRERIAAAESG